MALVNDGNGSGMIMPVAPMVGGYGNGGGGFDGFGGSGWWVILFLFALMGGWGNGFGGFGGGNGMFPWWIMSGQANTNNDVQRGFDQSAVMSGINGISNAITSGFGNVQTSLCNGFAQAEIANNARQIADMQQAFASQTAMAQGFNQLGSQFANCCCENRLGVANLANVVQTENCADRAAISDGIRDVIENCNRNNQRILDQLCADKIDAKNEKIADLERQLQMADLRASQIAQTAQIRAGQVEEIDAMYNRLRDCPVPCMPVYGSQPIFTCPNNNNYGCGNNF